MIPQSCLLIETKEFPVLDREKDNLVDQGMVGTALCNDF